MPRREVLHGAVGLPAVLRGAIFTALLAISFTSGLLADGPAKNDLDAEAERLALAVSDISTEIESALADASGLDGPVGSLAQKGSRCLETGRNLLARTTDLHGAALGLVREARDACGGASGIGLEAAGMEVRDIVKLNWYVVGQIDAQRRRELVSEFLGDHRPASTFVYVAGLASPDYKVEIEAWACKA